MSRSSGSWVRPFSIPDDVDSAEVVKASGVVKLPLRVNWTLPEAQYDLDDRRDRARVYEQVLREGIDDDVRYFIDVDRLIDLWDELVLPGYLRSAWAQWLQDRRQISLRY